ncbi:MAG: GTPase ObgE [Pseudodesulfovibrio sp.]|uniref:GTPase Obg n=1 Tax=Pseudodesulfovibrio aespoeensis (strain ATCC 700646 / DSM 10631 / Aspo-2) TaxID=643562 RepID=E6VY59_PSEA9|nr:MULTISPECIES: GTPase ObgE [Pseudodesulfovibrio]MBU4190815.1 GTPase ObgE [Pseudomonadota bacterium]ADU63873.1 GTP-binding protein Obg/CgtA [Pseudodesulfovibrio aespoeensis Aspo-2]MBU4243780.1 GTPase ObgE [Pseudomonadota bacterium]MBU4378556.1 GTPase ObgE [Pseudomonadota bacterium]MBU4475711.1 GTPase ObgE [Pseudomonadota bacterium]
MRFVDEATILVRSGKGGNGCASLHREANVPKGGPDGGDGGRGGDVIFRGTVRLMSLYDFRLHRHYYAKNGQSGMGRDRYGKAAPTLMVDLPVGTLVYEMVELEDGSIQEKLIADLVEDGTEVVICKGGDGGRGNLHFKSSVNRTPRFAEPGWPGEEKQIRLELKILADVGLLGLPNAGKSTFISQVSAAKPKIAAYPFTTLHPNLGVIENDEFERMVIADIPGLIEGASAGLGLGITFLKHVERTRFLVHILAAEDLNRDNPADGYDMLNQELHEYSPELAQKTQIRVINKIDTLGDDELAEIRSKVEGTGQKVFFISALTGQGVDKLVAEMWRTLAFIDGK